MSIKSKGRKFGRIIHRKAKSIPFTTAMKLGKMHAQGKDVWEMREKFPDLFRYVTECECCGPIEVFVPTGDHAWKFFRSGLST